MDRVEPEPIAVIVAEPHERIVDEKGPNLSAASIVEVDGVPPRGAVAIGEVGTEAREVVAVRTEVVVDDVDDHAHTSAVAGVDQSLQSIRSPVRMVRSEDVDSVVAPSASARKL